MYSLRTYYGFMELVTWLAKRLCEQIRCRSMWECCQPVKLTQCFAQSRKENFPWNRKFLYKTFQGKKKKKKQYTNRGPLPAQHALSRHPAPSPLDCIGICILYASAPFPRSPLALSYILAAGCSVSPTSYLPLSSTSPSTTPFPLSVK